MAREQKWTITSDLSGDEISEKEAAEVRITYPDGSSRTLDASIAELAQFDDKGKFSKRRGRQPGSKNKPKDSDAA